MPVGAAVRALRAQKAAHLTETGDSLTGRLVPLRVVPNSKHGDGDSVAKRMLCWGSHRDRPRRTVWADPPPPRAEFSASDVPMWGLGDSEGGVLCSVGRWAGSPSSSHHKPTSWLCGLACSGRVLSTESHTVCPSGSGVPPEHRGSRSLHVAACVRASLLFLAES